MSENHKLKARQIGSLIEGAVQRWLVVARDYCAQGVEAITPENTIQIIVETGRADYQITNDAGLNLYKYETNNINGLIDTVRNGVTSLLGHPVPATLEKFFMAPTAAGSASKTADQIGVAVIQILDIGIAQGILAIEERNHLQRGILTRFDRRHQKLYPKTYF